MLAVNPTLRQLASWDRIGRDFCDVTLLAIGLTPVILTGGIDLSVGSVVGLAAVTAGFLWRDLGLPIEIALAGCLVTGLAAGTVNGSLVLAGVSPLVVTLATLAVFRGLAYGLSGAQAVDNFPMGLQRWWDGQFLFLPHPVWLVMVAFAVAAMLLHFTWMGRTLYALGDNATAAQFAGAPVRGLTFAVYAASGFLAGIAGLASVLRFRAAPADQGEGLELTAIAAVVLGGVRITGGSGTILGTMLGSLTLAALLAGMAAIPGRWRTLLTGLFLVVIAVLNEGLARWQTRAAQIQSGGTA
jgi:rhamnose transport system permease protein